MCGLFLSNDDGTRVFQGRDQGLFRKPDWKDKTGSTNISMRTTVLASERATRPAGPAFPPNCFNNSPQSVKNNPPAENE
jgi:hypothetical protein